MLYGGQNTGLLIQQMQDNFQGQLKDLKDEKIKLIQILNKFLNLPQSDTTLNQTIDDYLNGSADQSNNLINFEQQPSKQYFEEFRLQITQALNKQQVDLSTIDLQKENLEKEKQKMYEDKVKLEGKRQSLNDKVQKLKSKTEELNKKSQLLDDRESLLSQQELKLRYKKQALDEEWSRLDKKREDLQQQDASVKKEWEILKKESQEISSMRDKQREEKQSIKLGKVQMEERNKILSQKEQELNSLQLNLDDITRSQVLRERKVERDLGKIENMRKLMKSDQDEIQKQKDFIREERQRLDNEKQEIDNKRSLSSMYIPDLKNLVSKMQSNKNNCKSVNRVPSQKSYINDGEMRIKQQNDNQHNNHQPKILTNMNAYINKCSGDHTCGGENGVFNCDIHKSMNKSTISLSNIYQPQSQMRQQQNQSLTAIGSGRTSYKNYASNQSSTSSFITNQQTANNSQISLQKAIMRNNSFKRPQAPIVKTENNYNSTHLSFKIPQTTKNNNLKNFRQNDSLILDDNSSIINDCHNKENLSYIMNMKRDKNLESILKDTAKFKLQGIRLEESYNSLDQSQINPYPNNLNNKGINDLEMSFMSMMEQEFEDDQLIKISEDNIMRQFNGHSLSREEL